MICTRSLRRSSTTNLLDSAYDKKLCPIPVVGCLTHILVDFSLRDSETDMNPVMKFS